MEKRFRTNKQLKDDYITFMREYEKLGHMRRINEHDISIDSSLCFYLPHHAVHKESTTTKTRVVFDGSASTSSGISLNETLMVGPVCQPNMLQTLIKFRQNTIAFTADIEKMYRQVLINESDANYQRILWREAEDQPVHHYKLLTVTYGLSCAPYQATRVLKQISIECEQVYPKISKMIEEEFYVDDLLSGTDSVEDAVYVYDHLESVLKDYGFHLRKWKSNSLEFLSHIPDDNKEIIPRIFDDDSIVTKVLGLQWNPSSDKLVYRYSLIESTKVTKRSILSEVSRLFDPIGFLSPVLIKFKILLQKLWLLQADWDDPVPQIILNTWNTIKNDLCNVHQIEIQRCMKISNAIKYQLIGFSDASEAAYGAVVYLKSSNELGESEIQMVTSKSRVAPLKVTSVPRLELNAAVILARLIKFIKNTLRYEEVEIYAFTDSTTVLAWLSQEPYKLKTYVANRVQEIIEVVQPHHWRYVQSRENPADYVSRGVTTTELLHLNDWWIGPEWLKNDVIKWPNENIRTDSLNVQKEFRKKITTLLSQVQHEFFNDICGRFSSYMKLIKFIASWFRIIKYLKYKEKSKLSFTANELNAAEIFCIKLCQNVNFKNDIDDLKKRSMVHKTSALLSLHPFIDDNGLLRVGGRLAESTLPYNVKHPMLLPQKHSFTKLLVSHYHIKYLHAGPTLLTSIIKRRIWIIRCRDVAKFIVNRCLICFKHKQQVAEQLMGDVPKPRTEVQLRPFVNTGVDYAGPINLKLSNGRSKGRYKAYIVVYVCLATKALTIDLVSGLNSEAFIASLQRFCARRGIPHHIYSDNATTFVGAYKDLQQLFLSNSSAEHIQNYVSSQGITWHFIPPLSPHVGGMWEASVKSIKYHLKRILKDQLLSYEELNTLLLQVEAVLNSRPLCKLSEQAEEFEVLTPAHFLIGEPLTTIPELSLELVPMNRLTRYQKITKLKQSFWHHWHLSYLNALQYRTKWKVQHGNLNEGDLVIVKEEGVPPGKWIIAQVIRCYKGHDERVRIVDIKTSKGIYKRPITKLVKLPGPEEDEQ